MRVKNIGPICASQIIRCIAFGVILLPRVVSATIIPALDEQVYTKVSVAFDSEPFVVSYGQTVTLCATVTPSRMQSKIAFTSSPSGVFEINTGNAAGCEGISLTVKSSVAKCVSAGTITANMNGSSIKSVPGTVLLPTSIYSQLINSGYCMPIGCYSEEYNVIVRGPQGMDLTGVIMSEQVTNRRQVDSRPVCPWGAADDIYSFALARAESGVFGVVDELGIPGMSIGESCAHKEDQIVKVGACVMQPVTVLTFEADLSGARRISRSDEE